MGEEEKKGKNIKLLQTATVGVFVFVVATGLVVLVFAPDRMGAFAEFVNSIKYVFTAMVIPALIGSPLTDGVRNWTERKRHEGTVEENQGLVG